ncbi:uncharacterized protein SPSK_02417 [Sporothrix schenckii 1099-18]|uniref:Transcription factor Iwr1 domain-containing protein n=1 Tax=Sporothrix schenckii 1099-18 TaxID=1397361 RepID=A0A0F2MCA1_SPOSC|nr:uncharacterized protein SPSK_02417 [Sporothrix schenckii 1099-18]KJR86440.1 hypothetical protein SPSK_02417 [Sporothrix schenckii 1099-18]
MSLPPQVIQVKRKRTEEGPVPSFLRIEHAANKRHRSDAFFYRRHDPQAVAAAQAAKRAAELEAEASGRSPIRPPTIQSSKKGDEKKKTRAAGKEDKKEAVDATAPPAGASPAATSSASTVEPRRFHLSRDSLLAAHSNAAAVLGVSAVAGVRKRSRYSSASGGDASPAAVFVERSRRQRRQQLRRSQDRKAGASGRGGGGGRAALPSVDEPKPVAAMAPLPKRPGRRAAGGSGASTSGAATPASGGDLAETGDTLTLTPTPTATSSASGTPALPPSLRNRQWDTDMDQLTREMNDYTLEIIGRNLAAQQSQRAAALAREQREAERRAGDSDMSRLANERRRAAYAKYKPKPPGQRLAERQGAGAAGRLDDMSDDTLDVEDAGDGDNDDNDGSDGSETDEEDYVTETYVRVPGHEATRQAVANGAAVPGTVGLLVFDNEPDLEFFYGVEEDSDEDGEDDEDENAENYYTHDYPEDEVSSDDEYGRDAYHYRTGNASDLEEFEDSDVEGGGDAGVSGAGSGEIIGFPGNVKLTKPGDL